MEWDPTRFLQTLRPPGPFAVLVLNQPINRNVWNVLEKHASFIICADGGANQLYDMTLKFGKESIQLPDAIVGDMDSIRPAVRSHYERLNVKVVLNPEQESTDFTKCINYLRSNQEEILHAGRLKRPSATVSNRDERNLDIVVMGGLGGRVDQGLSQIHHIYTYSQLRPDDSCHPLGELYLVSEESISFVLRQGRNTILTPGGSKLGLKSKKPDLHTNCPLLNGHGARANDDENEKCSYLSQHVGIIPINGPAFISTSGLEWDVRDWKTEFGGQMSTSNHIRADMITIETSAPVLFTAELAERFKSGRE